MALIYHFKDINRGDTFLSKAFVLKRVDKVSRTTEPLDLTGYKVCFQIMKKNGGEVVHDVLTAIPDPKSGRIIILEWDVDLPADMYYYNVIIKSVTGAKLTYMKGQFNVLMNTPCKTI